jgi:hypothetical protein
MLEKFQEDALNELAKNGGFRFTEKWFTSTSGQIRPYEVQKKVLQIKDLNNKEIDIVLLVDKFEDDVEKMKELNFNSNDVIPLNQETWIFLKVAGFIGGATFDSLIEYWQDHKSWGTKKLIEYPELLTDLLNKDIEKGLKVFNHYYPMMGRKLLMALGFQSIEGFKEKYY